MKLEVIFNMEPKLPESLPIRIVSKQERLYRVYTQSITKNTQLNNYHYLDVNNDNKLILKETKECAFEADAVHRFTPIIKNGEILPALYLANTPQTALSETIFRKSDIIAGYTPKPITLKNVAGKFMNLLSINRDLKLCNLTSPYLKDGKSPVFDFSEHDSISGPASLKCYKRCHDIATAIYNHSDQVDGIYWESRHLANTFNILVWDKRGTPVLNKIMHEYPLSIGNGLNEVREEANRIGIPASSLVI